MFIHGIVNGEKYMEQNSQEYKNNLLKQVKEQYGRLVYTYTCHLKNANYIRNDNARFKWIQIALSAISTSGFIFTIVTDQVKASWISGICSILLLFVSGYLKDKDFSDEQKSHLDVASKLWIIREKYISLLTDFSTIDIQEIIRRRDDLVLETSKIYSSAPKTDDRSYRAAQKALKEKNEQAFTKEEMNTLLPDYLREK